ncbi:hypothetical protein DYR28_13475 [Bacillus cereus]|nr:hypothetical protein DYR28_13475 [Bacillus cereus]
MNMYNSKYDEDLFLVPCPRLFLGNLKWRNSMNDVVIYMNNLNIKQKRVCKGSYRPSKGYCRDVGLDYVMLS